MNKASTWSAGRKLIDGGKLLRAGLKAHAWLGGSDEDEDREGQETFPIKRGIV